jgi:hypothetical protein
MVYEFWSPLSNGTTTLNSESVGMKFAPFYEDMVMFRIIVALCFFHLTSTVVKDIAKSVFPSWGKQQIWNSLMFSAPLFSMKHLGSAAREFSFNVIYRKGHVCRLRLEDF